ncbi:hypothetical protein OWV82_000036 [Melia azedarach]|uniref:Uncharacterized protein n=1 Tax=Melia azedarach TaxID=155640 RepID=A0ACC1YUX3_MELAZ|nr:hypothetical protein OWV82_000036 [Melia azedarach]
MLYIVFCFDPKDNNKDGSLQRGPVRPPGNGCTFIPGRGGAPCTNQMNFAGRAMPPPRVYPDHMISFGVATHRK